ncbi:MAG: hypothetical protein FWE42_03725 [Defluviitaleaceae bacterium]|nr:hypothetical protein [Defluviitaleaceae bacterium]
MKTKWKAIIIVMLILLFALIGCSINGSTEIQENNTPYLGDGISYTDDVISLECNEYEDSGELAEEVVHSVLVENEDINEDVFRYAMEESLFHYSCPYSDEFYDSESEHGGDFYIGTFRPRFYTLPAPFVDLIGCEAYFEWILSRTMEEMESESVAVAFIRDFNISREDFSRANEELRQIWQSIEGCPSITASFEIYPVDLIFSFDNERINEYFLWENSPGVLDFGMGTGFGDGDRDRRILFYHMPGPFMELVGRETFIEWRRNRSPEETANESIAVSFIRDFNVNMRDFTRANNEVQQVWNQLGLSAQDSSVWEVYNVEMVFSMDNAAINEYFRMENSQAAHEREWAATR